MTLKSFEELTRDRVALTLRPSASPTDGDEKSNRLATPNRPSADASAEAQGFQRLRSSQVPTVLSASWPHWGLNE